MEKVKENDIEASTANVRESRVDRGDGGDVVAGYPISCFLGAVASGYLIGRIARRI